jgi:hypothetical protein
MTAYMRYMADIRNDVVDANPSLSMTEVAREGSKRWNVLTDEERMPYNDIYEQDYEEYKK